MKTNQILAIALLATSVFSSCRRDNDNDRDNDTTGARDHALAEASFEEVQSIADQAEEGSLGNYRAMEDTIYLGCATVIRDTTTTPRTITVDFGTVNCTCQDGRTRRGKIISTYTGAYRDSGTVITHTTVDYYVNDNKIIGTKTVTNKGKNSSNHTWYTVQVNGSIEKANGAGTISFNSSREREWIEGENTAGGLWQDDVYSITGTASGTTANGNSFTASITEALRIELSCSHITSGELEFTPSTRPVRTVNFGTGNCDNLATVTINGNVYNVTLH